MQTFLPLPSLRESLLTLDKKRLGNQVYREALTLLNGGWFNHPASKMWRGYERGLIEYILEGVRVLEERGGNFDWLKDDVMSRPEFKNDLVLPPWFGDDRLHSSHRSNLLRKDFEYYSQFCWTEVPGMPYYWPEV